MKVLKDIDAITTKFQGYISDEHWLMVQSKDGNWHSSPSADEKRSQVAALLEDLRVVQDIVAALREAETDLTGDRTELVFDSLARLSTSTALKAKPPLMAEVLNIEVTFAVKVDNFGLLRSLLSTTEEDKETAKKVLLQGRPGTIFTLYDLAQEQDCSGQHLPPLCPHHFLCLVISFPIEVFSISSSSVLVSLSQRFLHFELLPLPAITYPFMPSSQFPSVAWKFFQR